MDGIVTARRCGVNGHFARSLDLEAPARIAVNHIVLKGDSLPALAELQKGLLQSAARAVRPGGVVAYSTCSIEEEENEAVVADVVESGLLTKQTERLFLPRPGAGGGYVALLHRPAPEEEA